MLKSHGDTAKTHFTSAKSLLHHLMRQVQSHRGWIPIHASDITKEGSDEFCPRQVALHLINDDLPGNEGISACNQYMFDLGRFIEGLVRDVYLSDYVYGNWECKDCGAQTVKPSMKPAHCGCGSVDISYREIILPRMNIASCGIDMLLFLPGDTKLTLYEIKSLERKYFDELMAPKSEHLNRTRYYLSFIADHPELSQITHLTHAKILYVCKGWGKSETIELMDGMTEKFTPFMEFEVPHSPETAEYYDKRLIPIVEYMENKTMPGGICKSIGSTRAKWCPKKKDCFGGQYPAGSKVE